jgi:hypothetical protein
MGIIYQIFPTFAILPPSPYYIPASLSRHRTSMKIPVGNKYVVEILTPRGLGGGQIVRVYRKLLFFRKRLSSNWFLDQKQAERFARTAVANLAQGKNGASPRPPL